MKYLMKARKCLIEKYSIANINSLLLVFVSCMATSAMSASPVKADCRIVPQGVRTRLECDSITTNDISREIQNCFSGGCDPGNLIETGIPSEEIWGEAGRFGYPSAAEVMDERNRDGVPLTLYQKSYLRIFFGDLVDRVRVTYNANMLDEVSYRGMSIQLGSDGQTFCEDIYINGPFAERSQSQLELLAHELVHSEQCQNLGGADDFGYHYFKEYKKAGQNYCNNVLEVEAYNREAQFSVYLDELSRLARGGTDARELAGEDISVGQNRDGRLEVFWRGDDGQLWHAWQEAPGGSWSGASRLGVGSASDISVGQNRDGRLEVFWRGDDGQLWHAWQEAPGGGWSGASRLGVGSASDISVGQNRDGRLEVFWRGDDGQLWHAWQETPGGSWSDASPWRRKC